MKITEEMAEILERNANVIEITERDGEHVSIKFIFEPSLDMKSEDGKIFAQELKKQMRLT